MNEIELIDNKDNKSVKYIKSLIENERFLTVDVDDLNQCNVFDFFDILNNMLNINTIIKNSMKLTNTLDDGTKIGIVIERCNDCDEFDYVASKTLSHDGTLLFELECIGNILNTVMKGETYFKESKYNHADYILQHEDVNIKYMVGDIVIVRKFGNPGEYNEDKPWITQKNIVMLPIKYIFEPIELSNKVKDDANE